jgi:hypothetical protein
MKFSEVARRLTGISCPIFGVSWDPGVAKVTSARRVLTYLEDRRVLFVPFEVEMPEHCVDSILDIRRFLTAELGQLDDKDDDVAPHLRAMRASCREFLDRVATLDGGPGAFRRPFYGSQEWMFNQALGELRGVFGVHVAQLSAKFGIDIEDDLAVILPAELTDDEGGDSDDPRHPLFDRF